MAKCSILFFYFFQGVIHHLSGQQQHTTGPWRQRIQWENNGHVYSLMSTGSEYQTPARSGSQSRVYMSSRRDGTRSQMPRAHRRVTLVRTGQGEARQFTTDHGVGLRSFTSGHDGRQSVSVNAGASGARQRAHGAGAAGSPGARRVSAEHVNSITSVPGRFTNQSSSGAATTLERRSEPPTPSPAVTEDAAIHPTTNAEDMVNDDPRNPFKNHRNSVFYNMYPTRGRSGARTRRPPGTGYGTSYFQNGELRVI